MKKQIVRRTGFVCAIAATAVLAGCTNYVKMEDFNAVKSDVAQLQQNQQQLQQHVASLEARVKQTFAKYDKRLTALEGRIRVDNVAYFPFDSAELQDKYKPMLDEFAQVMRDSHGNAVITVEGFTDPAGSKAYNERLGLERAQAVRDYLVNQGGLAANQVRAVSYGESDNRQVAQGEIREDGSKNRRTTLVIDFAS